MHKYNLKCRIIWLCTGACLGKIYIKKLVSASSDHPPSSEYKAHCIIFRFSLILHFIRWSIIIPIWYALMQMMQQIINKATTTLKTEYILRTNKPVLMTNVLIYVSTSSRKVLSPNKCLSYTIPRCLFIPFYRFNLYSK